MTTLQKHLYRPVTQAELTLEEETAKLSKLSQREVASYTVALMSCLLSGCIPSYVLPELHPSDCGGLRVLTPNGKLILALLFYTEVTYNLALHLNRDLRDLRRNTSRYDEWVMANRKEPTKESN